MNDINDSSVVVRMKSIIFNLHIILKQVYNNKIWNIPIKVPGNPLSCRRIARSGNN